MGTIRWNNVMGVSGPTELSAAPSCCVVTYGAGTLTLGHNSHCHTSCLGTGRETGTGKCSHSLQLTVTLRVFPECLLYTHKCSGRCVYLDELNKERKEKEKESERSSCWLEATQLLNSRNRICTHSNLNPEASCKDHCRTFHPGGGGR